MATEIRTISDPAWPSGVRLPVALTFEHQSGEGAPLLPGDRPNAMVGGAMEYGGRRGMWNILEVLDACGVKATFFVCGTTAEKYPDVVRAAHADGHEIAGMSYAFERVRTASPARERGIVRALQRPWKTPAEAELADGGALIIASARRLSTSSQSSILRGTAVCSMTTCPVSSSVQAAHSSSFRSPPARPTRPTSAIPTRCGEVRMAWRMCGTANSMCCIARANTRRAS